MTSSRARNSFSEETISIVLHQAMEIASSFIRLPRRVMEQEPWVDPWCAPSFNLRSLRFDLAGAMTSPVLFSLS